MLSIGKLVEILGKCILFIVLLLLSVFFIICFFWLLNDNFSLIFVMGCLFEFFVVMMFILFFMMFGDSVDYFEWKNKCCVIGFIYLVGIFV